MKESRQATQSPLLPRSSRIIGREDFLDAIRNAITDKAGQSCVLYFVGPGGIGKTRLLEEVANIQREFKGKPFLWSGIIDLYHEENHSPDTLKEAIVRGVDPKKRHFQKFWKCRELMKEKRRQGIVGPEFEKIRKQLNDQFLEEYKILASQRRLVLCFDTMELIQYESDIVQKICQVEDEDAVVKNWLLNQISLMPNTLTIFAGRPLPKLKKDFERAFKNASIDFVSYPLNGFTEIEVQDYLDEMLKIHPNLVGYFEPAERIWISKLSQGRPIRLALCIDLIQAGGGPLSSPNGEDDIDLKLIENLLDLSARKLASPYRELIEYLVLARKGLDRDLLSYLTGWSKKKSSDNLARIANLEIVKRRPGTEQLFLHDEIYDLVDKYFKNTPPDLGKIARYYSNLLELADPDKNQELVFTPDKRQELSAKFLYYEFQINANIGYHRYYARQDEDAILGHEIGFDMRLRDEGLRFMYRYANESSPFHDPRVSDVVDRKAIDRDCAVRWIKRYIARGEYKKACQVAERVRYSKATDFNWESVSDPLYKAGLLTAWAEAMIYAGSPENETKRNLEDAIDLLNDVQGFDENQDWWKTRILGSAYNLFGYLHRTQGRNISALKNYSRALSFFSTPGLQEEKANVLNNLAFTNALLGRYVKARDKVNEAIEIRERLGKKYPLALSYNTRGRIHVLGDHPDWGEQDCRRALRIFEELNDPRGRGLAQVGLGLTLRKRGDQWKLGVYSHKEAEFFFKEADLHFKQAIGIFSNEVFEPVQLWEAYNELGSLYCDWGWLMRNQKEKDSAKIGIKVLEQYKNSINYQEKALKITKTHNLSSRIADSLDDLAQVYADRSFLLRDMGRLKEAHKSISIASSYLDEVNNVVPEEYLLQQGIGFSHSADPESGEVYWLALGKMNLQRGIWLFEMLRREQNSGQISIEEREDRIRDGIFHFALATAFFQQYWPESHAFLEGLNVCAKHLQRIGVAADLANLQVDVVAARYCVILDPLLKVIEDI